MHRTIRMTTSEYDLLQAFKEYVKISGFFPKNFDDKDIVNLIIHYFSRENTISKDFILHKGAHFAKQNISLGDNLIYKNIVDMGIFDFLNEKPENKAFILDEPSEDEIKNIQGKTPGESLSSIIKNLIFGIITDPKKVVDIMVGYLFSQAFLFISYDSRSHKYSFERAKQDYIATGKPSIDIKESELSNYYSVLKKLRTDDFLSFDGVLKFSHISEMDQNEILKSLRNGFLAMSGYKSGLPPSVKPMEAFSAKVFSMSLPTMLCHKLVSIGLIYSGLKKISTPQPITSIIDNITETVLLDNNGNVETNKGKIGMDFDDIAQIIGKWVNEWEKYVKQFDKND